RRGAVADVDPAVRHPQRGEPAARPRPGDRAGYAVEPAAALAGRSEVRRRMVVAAAAVLAGLLVSSCSSDGIYSIPLPGGADVGSDPMHIDIRFDDVLDLVPQSAVKVEGVPVGRVQDITLAEDGWTANVSTVVNSSVDLP